MEVIEVTPSQVCFPGAQLAGRLETSVVRNGKPTQQIVYLLSSRSLAELEAAGMLQSKRGYWAIESRLHHCLDITMQEDLSRVRNPNSARALGILRRIVLSLSNAAIDQERKKKPKTKANTKTFRQTFLAAKTGDQRLHALIFAKHPDVRDFRI